MGLFPGGAVVIVMTGSQAGKCHNVSIETAPTYKCLCFLYAHTEMLKQTINCQLVEVDGDTTLSKKKPKERQQRCDSFLSQTCLCEATPACGSFKPSWCSDIHSVASVDRKRWLNNLERTRLASVVKLGFHPMFTVVNSSSGSLDQVGKL